LDNIIPSPSPLTPLPQVSVPGVHKGQKMPAMPKLHMKYFCIKEAVDMAVTFWTSAFKEGFKKCIKQANKASFV
jgi:hypothetical protein